jgi:hypothetical protein
LFGLARFAELVVVGLKNASIVRFDIVLIVEKLTEGGYSVEETRGCVEVGTLVLTHNN